MRASLHPRHLGQLAGSIEDGVAWLAEAQDHAKILFGAGSQLAESVARLRPPSRGGEFFDIGSMDA
jgi:hypothetical protein